MSTSTLAAKNYGTLNETTRSNRDLEYDAILRVTRELKLNKNAAKAEFPRLAVALSRNERLWNEIGTQVADNANKLDVGLRARLFYISEFVAHYTGNLLRGEGDVSSLIDINVAVLRGLKGKT